MIIVVELNSEDLSYFSNFEKITGVMPADYLNSDSLLIFLVSQIELGKAIGKKGMNIEKLKQLFRKKIVIVADSKELEIFVKQFFNNISIISVEIRDVMGENAVVLTVEEKDRGIAIGKDGERIKAAKLLLAKKFNATLHLKTKRNI